MTSVDIAAALLRTTLATSAAALVAWALLTALRVNSPRIHRIAWLLVIAQGWLFFSLTIEIETLTPPTIAPPTVSRDAPAERAALWSPEPFTTSVSPSNNAPQSPKVPDTLSLPNITIASWLLGALALTAISLRRYLQVLRTLPLGSPPDDSAWQAEWHAARATAKLRRRQVVDLRITTSLGPLLHWAPWAYLILVPRTFWTTLAAPQRQAILRHELAHLCRGDLWKSLAIRVLALPQWFNPLAWLAIRRFDEAAEWACDDAAAATAASRLTFANSLLHAAEYAATPCPGSAPAARGVLTRRIHRLVSPRFKEESKMKLLALPLLLLLLTAFQSLRIERVVAAEKDEVKPQTQPQPEWLTTLFSIDVPVAKRLKDAEKWNSQLKQYAEIYRDFEIAARSDYVIEPPDVLLFSFAAKLKVSADTKGVYFVDKERLQADGGFIALQSKPRRTLVAMDGQIKITNADSVYVAGKTIDEAREAIAKKLRRDDCEIDVSLTIAQHNSKVYYIVKSDCVGGDEVTRMPAPFPIDGKETVGVALAREFGAAESSIPIDELKSARITLRRPAPNGVGKERIYAIEWDGARSAPTPLTDFPLLPGDRLFVELSMAGGVEQENLPTTKFPTPPPIPTSPYFRYGISEDASPNVAPAAVNDHYRLRPYDTIKLRATRPHRPAHALTWGDIEGEFTVDYRGEIDLSHKLGIVAVADLSADEARAAIERQLRKELPDCEVQLSLVTLAAEKYVISIQRADGTEIAAGALQPKDLSEEEFFRFQSFVGELVPIQEVQLERTGPQGNVESIKLSTVWDAVQLPLMPANEHHVRLGDRLIITVADDWQPRIYPPWLVHCDVEGEREQVRYRIVPGWSPVFNTQFDHPEIQRPAVSISY
jgi:beta-lactamase regulating signal transducer with metallopeptidase domain/protein involved in polysaccharide export with SLBB domain